MDLINFAGDNLAAVHPKVIEKIIEVNKGSAKAYGDDIYTARLKLLLNELFGADIGVFPVFNGTGANTVSLMTLCDFNSMILTAPLAHITEDECGAVNRMTGCAIRYAGSTPGKVNPDKLEPFLYVKGDVHKSQPGLVSISQAAETGELYTVEEIDSIGAFCHKNGLYLHIDGSRLANACAALGADAGRMTAACDIVSFGGTKNGLMGAEALIVRNPDFISRAAYARKQGMQLASKMRYLSAQLIASLEGGLWLETATHANKQMSKLCEYLKERADISFLYKPEINMCFVEMPEALADKLSEHFYFYIMSKAENKVKARLMTTWQTTDEDVCHFGKYIRDFAG